MTDTPSPATAPLYMLALPMRTEGPYSLDELRNLLREGHARPADRVEQVGALRGSTIAELIPDADSIKVSTDRVVRRSGSSARLAKASSDGQARRYRTPAPSIVAAEQAPAHATPPGEGAGAAAAPTCRPPSLVVGGLAIISLALGLAALLWEAGWFDAPPPPVPMIGWMVNFGGSAGATSAAGSVTGAGPHGGPWELRIMNGKMVVTAPDNSTTTHAVTLGPGSSTQAQYLLAPPHPTLGAVITISDGDPLVIEAAGARGRGHALPASDSL